MTPDVAGGTVFRIRYRAPYDWDSVLEFLQARAIPGIELVEKNIYKCTVEIGGQAGFIKVKHLPRKDSLYCYHSLSHRASSAGDRKPS